MKRLIMLATVLAALPSAIWAGGPCPNSFQLYCGRSCDTMYNREITHCTAYQTAGATEACELEAESSRDDCYANCAISSGCSAI